MRELSVVLLAFLLLFFILDISEITIVKGELCETMSKTWFGKCKDSDKCDKQCIEWEGAAHGACHQREVKDMCFCYIDCSVKDKKPPPPPPPAPSPAPPVGGQPPPPKGGQPPPGCNKLYVDNLIAEAIAKYKIQIEKMSHIDHQFEPMGGY